MARAPRAQAAQTRLPEEPDDASRLLGLVRALTLELHPQICGIDRLGPEASLERDFGLGSLARVELASRIEQLFGIVLPETVLAEADSVNDLVCAVRRTRASAPSSTAASVLPARLELTASQPSNPETLQEALDWHARTHPDRTYILLVEHQAAPEPITFGALRSEALAVAAGLAQAGVQPHEAVAIMLPTGREFFAAFFGALHAQCIPVPLYPPARASQLEIHLHRLAGILANCQARVLLTAEAARRVSHLLRGLGTHLEQITTTRAISASPENAPALRMSAQDIAFLQYTSGSTGQPKGVVLTHANVLANLRAMQQVTGVTSADCFLSWLPLYHDMGLIGACLGALVVGYPLVLMSPFAFLSRPARWLQRITEHRATITAAPNFAYELCLNKLDERALQGIDLSCLRLAFNGAEAVSAHTIERFAERLAPYGLKREALMPVYGLAEGALGVTFPPIGRGPLIDHIDRATFLRTGIARPSAGAQSSVLQVVSCGRPLPGYAIRIVDEDGTELPERTQGRIEFQGPSATRGYYRNSEQTARLFDGPWLDTGDLGYLADGELYVTGRAKDIIIRGGQNIHPQELEEAVARLPGVRKGGVVVFPARDPRSGTERIVLLAETTEEEEAQRFELLSRINRLAVELIGLPVDEIVLAKPRSVLKTSSGKIRRAACREAYERGQLSLATRAPWIQLARLSWQAFVGSVQRTLRRSLRMVWGIRALAIGGLLAPLLWLTVVLTPGLARRRRVCADFARLAMRLAGIRLSVQQIQPFDRRPRVFVSNHASYLDGVVLLAALPPDITFVAKAELRHTFPMNMLLKQLDCVFVERHEVHEASLAARELEERMRAGGSLVVFPEGTFRREAGLLPFHMGAFTAAASTAAAIIPVAICGTRAMLPDGALLPRPARLSVIIGEPLIPEDESWRSAVQLRSKARAFLLQHVGEPDLAHRPAGTM
jgi:1-acyl-sn-glycerol-3-phosphate acyltransferase